MAGNNGPQGDDWEDQLRRMLHQSQTRQQMPPPPHAAPVVRLPPGEHQPPSQHQLLPPVSHTVVNKRQPLPNHAHTVQPSAAQQHSFIGARDYVRSNQQPQFRQPMDPNSFEGRGRGRGRGFHNQSGPLRGLYNPSRPARPHPAADQFNRHLRQADYLEHIANAEVPVVEMDQAERAEKDAFRLVVENIIHDICNTNPERLPKVSLQCFGSFQSGFATKGSDMDLVIVLQDGSAAACFALDEDDLPRTLEKKMLELGYGARLLTRTRVPILKLCEKPTGSLLEALREERSKWDVLLPEGKYPHLFPDYVNDMPGTGDQSAAAGAATDSTPNAVTKDISMESKLANLAVEDGLPGAHPLARFADTAAPNNSAKPRQHDGTDQQRRDREWTRERKSGPLDFPSDGVGIHSDINFFNPLGLHNTQLLRCYSMCDPRVRPMILFVKSWAKRRKINSSYSGTLSSYGYVLMVLHYLMNIAQPAVVPNLQGPWRPGPGYTPHGASAVEVDNWMVNFWRNEAEIEDAVRKGQMTPNKQPLGALLAGFFNYFSSQGDDPVFHWMQQCLSLRTQGGVLSKDEKGWTRAVTEESEGKRVQHRYLFCIEDPFELGHNVARTVTHNGIVAIRDEFRRAHRILLSVSNGYDPRDGELFAPVTEAEEIQRMPQRKPREMPVTTNRNNGFGNDHGNENGGDGGHARRNTRGGHAPTPAQTTHRQHNTPPPASNTAAYYEESFPSLGTPSNPKTGKNGISTPQKTHTRDNSHNFSEVSGDKARAVLEEVRRKRMEQHAESTALGAAESVLNGMD